MILDPTGQFIRHITGQCDISGRDILEIGCGSGRITLDLARHARRVVAIDPDGAALRAARSGISGANVEFIRCGGESLAFPEHTFDLVVYSLSLHHLPIGCMLKSLMQAARLLREKGEIVVIEPGMEGTLIEAEERFGVGDGDEREEKEAALRAMGGLAGWEMGETIHFQTLFYFADERDFLESLLPEYRRVPKERIREIGHFLQTHEKDGRIVLHAGRRLNVLKRSPDTT